MNCRLSGCRGHELHRFVSKGKNTPLAGRRLKGRVVATVCEGRVVFDGR